MAHQAGKGRHHDDLPIVRNARRKLFHFCCGAYEAKTVAQPLHDCAGRKTLPSSRYCVVDPRRQPMVVSRRLRDTTACKPVLRVRKQPVP